MIFILLLLLFSCSIKDIPNPISVKECFSGNDCYFDDIPTHGNAYIYDKHGRITIYHGFVSAGTSKSNELNLPWQTFEHYKELKNRGFNHLKFMFFWSAVEPNEGEYNDEYIDGVLKHIGWCDQLGIDVVLDMHKDVYGPYFGVESSSGIPIWATNSDSIYFNYNDADIEEWGLYYLEPAVQEAFKNFWEGTKYKKKYINMLRYVFEKIESRNFSIDIGLDPMNEPFPHNFKTLDGNIKDNISQVLHNINSSNDFERYYLAPFYENVKSMFEHYFPNKRYRLFFEPWMSTSSGYPSKITEYYNYRPEDVYYPHLYLLTMLMGEDYGGDFNEKELETNLEMKIIEAKKEGIPIMIGEFGADIRKNTSYKYIEDVLNIFNKYGIGWNYYTLERIGASEYGVYNQDSTFNKMMGILTLVYAQKISGESPKFDRGSDYYSLSYIKDNSIKEPTEIYIPNGLDSVEITINEKEYSYKNSNVFKYYNKESGNKQNIKVTWR